MKKAVIYCFSGTGNTAYVAKLISDQLSKAITDCQVIPMEECTLLGKPIQVERGTLIGIGFPVHAMNAPKLVYDFLALLPSGRFPYFSFKTAGDPLFNAGSNLPLRKQLGIKGWRCLHESLFVMPSNMASKNAPEKVKQLALIAHKQASKVGEQILNGTMVREPQTALTPLFAIFSRLETLGAKKNSSKWRVKDNCIHCGKCAANCPTQNITRSGNNLIFGDNCIWCLRCSFNCPTQALVIGNKILARLLAEPYNIAKIVADESITADFFGENTLRTYRRYKKYWQNQGLIDTAVTDR